LNLERGLRFRAEASFILGSLRKQIMKDVFLQRARQLRSARELIEEERLFASATALLSVHSAIALNDALLSIWRGRAVKSEDHREATRATQSECRIRKLDSAGVRHLEALIQNKSQISYGDAPVTYEKAMALALSARRFEAWTFKTCKELAQWEQRQPAPSG
jgi:hypothetical protein